MKYSLFIVAAVAVFLVLPHGSQAISKETVVDCRADNEQCWPTAFEMAPGGRIFYVERFSGHLRVYNPRTGVDKRWASLRNIGADGEQGVLGLALDPRWETKKHRWVYVYKTHGDPLENRVIRLRKRRGTVVRDRLLTLPAANYHNGGVIEFGPDGKLYVQIGDVTNPALSQDEESNAGKVLRLNKGGGIPKDNPLGGTVKWYSTGHRNMYGMAFDHRDPHPKTHEVWVTENGPACNDEINKVRKGKNYGWGVNQACPETNNTGSNVQQPKYTWADPPAVTGAAFCQKCGLGRSVRGDLLVGAWNTGAIMNATLNARRSGITKLERLFTNDTGVLTLRRGRNNKILFSDPNGIYRLKR